MTPREATERRLPLWLAGIATSLGLAAALLVQSARQGWPFGLIASPQHPGGHPAASGAPPQAHGRVPVEVDLAKQSQLGIQLAEVRVESISTTVRAVATVVPDESRLSHVHTRVSGWIEALYVRTTGEEVRAGQPLAGIFSQELLASQMEYLAARRAAASGPVSAAVDSARTRLRVLGMSEWEIRDIERRGEPRRLVTVVAPRAGVILHRGVSVGTAVDPSIELFTVGDLSRVWVIAELPEADVPAIEVGSVATLELGAGEPRQARVDFIYPTLTERTRTVRARFVIDNEDGELRPGFYGTASLATEPRRALTVPRDAVVDTGAGQHLFVVAAPGRFEPRSVTTGERQGELVEITSGLSEGEAVVASGVFLIDSESRLQATGGGEHGGHEGHR